GSDAAPVRGQLHLQPVPGQEGREQPLACQLAGMVGVLAASTPQLGRAGSDGLSRPLRVLLARSRGGLPAAESPAVRGPDSVPHRPGTGTGLMALYDPWRHRYAVVCACATALLLVAGGLVTSTGSGLAVPDWPLSFGMVFPPMVGGILFEHGHRMVAGTVAILMLVLAVWLGLREPRRWVRVLGYAAMGTIVAQAVLGGVTVLLLLPPAVSASHACLAQTFFCLTVTIALVTSPRWAGAGAAVGAARAVASGAAG